MAGGDATNLPITRPTATAQNEGGRDAHNVVVPHGGEEGRRKHPDHAEGQCPREAAFPGGLGVGDRNSRERNARGQQEDFLPGALYRVEGSRG